MEIGKHGAVGKEMSSDYQKDRFTDAGPESCQLKHMRVCARAHTHT